LGWTKVHPAWFTSPNGPYAGIKLPVNHPNELWIPSGTYEPSITRVLVQLLTDERWSIKDKSVWDIGAHHAVTALLFAKHGAAEVVGLEPLPANLEIIRTVLAANESLAAKIRILPLAASVAEGEAVIETGATDSEGQLVHDQVTPSERRPDGSKRIAVCTSRLDHLLAKGFSPPGLLKIDIEGAEFLALQGARQLLLNHRPVLVIEIHNAGACAKCVELLRSLSYGVWRISAKGLNALRDRTMDYGHVLCVPLEHTNRRALPYLA
jgi:FkbM family methyltransferase